ncbi:MAG: O-antigen ligase family protein [Deltaproteobacteria bacterium]|nr:O-antigen ligase family protein [Deltaproteobacteria bacterium]
MNKVQPTISRYATTTVRYSLYCLLIFTPLARASVQPWAVTTIYMVTLIALTAFLLERSITSDWKWIKTSLDKPIIFLLILCILSTIFSMHRSISLWSIILLLNYLTIFYLVIHTVRTRSQLRNLIFIIIGVATFISIFGLFKWFGINPFPWWDYTDIVSQNPDRLSSTFGNPDHLAGYMEMSLPLILGLFLLGVRPGIFALLVYISCLLLSALILSLSRGGWFGTFIGLLFMASCLLADRYFKRKRMILTIIGGSLAVALIVFSTTPVVERIQTLTERDPATNLQGRLTAWAGMLDVIKEHPVIGTGPGTFATVFTQYQPPGVSCRYFQGHNDYLHFVSEAGLPLIAIIVWMIIALYRKGFRKLKNPSRLVRGITIGAMSGITAILVHGLGDFNLHIPSNALLFTVLAALVAAPLPKNTQQ